MISPKYSLTHYFTNPATLTAVPNIVNVYLDYNCPFSAKIFFKLRSSVIPALEKKHPSKFQFVFVNVVQPWHPNSVLLNEFSLVVAKFLRQKQVKDSNKLFWDVSETIFQNKELFYDTANVNLNRNEIYKQISSLVFSKVDLPFSENDVLNGLTFTHEEDISKVSNSGNEATVDIKYFTKYLRGVGVHVTPTVSINGIVNDSISSGDEVEKLIETFEKLIQ